MSIDNCDKNRLTVYNIYPCHVASQQMDELYFAICHSQSDSLVQLVLLERVYPTWFLYMHPVTRPRLHSLFRFPADKIADCLSEKTVVHCLGSGPHYVLLRDAANVTYMETYLWIWYLEKAMRNYAFIVQMDMIIK